MAIQTFNFFSTPTMTLEELVSVATRQLEEIQGPATKKQKTAIPQAQNQPKLLPFSIHQNIAKFLSFPCLLNITNASKTCSILFNHDVIWLQVAKRFENMQGHWITEFLPSPAQNEMPFTSHENKYAYIKVLAKLILWARRSQNPQNPTLITHWEKQILKTSPQFAACLRNKIKGTKEYPGMTLELLLQDSRRNQPRFTEDGISSVILEFPHRFKGLLFFGLHTFNQKPIPLTVHNNIIIWIVDGLITTELSFQDEAYLNRKNHYLDIFDHLCNNGLIITKDAFEKAFDGECSEGDGVQIFGDIDLIKKMLVQIEKQKADREGLVATIENLDVFILMNDLTELYSEDMVQNTVYPNEPIRTLDQLMQQFIDLIPAFKNHGLKATKKDLFTTIKFGYHILIGIFLRLDAPVSKETIKYLKKYYPTAQEIAEEPRLPELMAFYEKNIIGLIEDRRLAKPVFMSSPSEGNRRSAGGAGAAGAASAASGARSGSGSSSFVSSLSLGGAPSGAGSSSGAAGSSSGAAGSSSGAAGSSSRATPKSNSHWTNFFKNL
ncbi:MAG: hypothetical protein H0W88_08045 [Parachlamydiaceae bacterium]|nr:hypothetical protein [Parachlamydiaceae bacterium]